MHVAAVRVELLIREARSLKDKRRVLKSLVADLGKAHPVAVAEVDHQDLWQRATLGIAVVSSSPGQVERMVRAIERNLEVREDVELLATSRSYVAE